MITMIGGLNEIREGVASLVEKSYRFAYDK